MNLKKILAIVCLATCTAAPTMAQDATEGLDYKRFPHMFVGIQGGGQTTFTNYDNMKILTPTASAYFGAWFTPIVGARLHFNGLWNKGGINIQDADATYRYKYATSDLDLMLNLVTMFGKKDYYPVNLYLIGGIGLNVAWDNNEALAMKDVMPGAWAKNRLSHNARIGGMLDWNFHKNWSVNFEVSANSLSDRYNSKTNQRDDWQLTAQVGLTYKFGYKKANKAQKQVSPTTATSDYNSAEDNTSMIAEAKAKQAEAEERARAEAARKAEEAAKTAVVAKVEDEPLKETFFYNIRSTDPDPESTLNKIAAWCKKYPNKAITIAGYADKGTGTAEINKKYAMQRAQNVADQLVKKGVAKNRMQVTSFGDTVQPFSENDRNRCVIVVGEK